MDRGGPRGRRGFADTGSSRAAGSRIRGRPASRHSLFRKRPIATTPEAAWELIADITRMGDWSPETIGAEWSRGSSGPAPGARFKGTNQMGSKKWRSDCVVTGCVRENALRSTSRSGRSKWPAGPMSSRPATADAS